MMENTKASADVNAEAEVTAETSVETDAAAEVGTDVTAGADTETATEAETDAAAGVDTDAAAEAGTEAVVEVPAKETITEVLLQYRGYEMNMDDVTKRVKGHYMSKGFTEDSIENMQIYVKPEDFTAYYVINDGIVGKVNLF